MSELPELPPLPRHSKYAVASLGFALLNFCVLFVLGGILAVYCGFMARKAIRESNGELLGLPMANTGILVGAAGSVFMVIVLYGPVVMFQAWVEELGKIDAVVAEFKEAFNRGDAAAVREKMTPQGREGATPEDVRKKIDAAREKIGTIESYSRSLWTQFWHEPTTPPSFPYALKGTQGEFKAIFFCRKLEGGWHLERFELEP